MKASIVIGSSFGDEGKGYTVDALCRQHKNSLVIRHNGGSQAGHTVELSDGRKHVFKTFGSGSFRGSPTLLSRFFIFNVDVFVDELSDLGHDYTVYADEECKLTTPYDMLINWAIEDARGNDRHGSCGYGINETETRHAYDPKFQIFVSDLNDLESYRNKLKIIEKEWVPLRLKWLGLNLDIHLSDKDIQMYFIRCKIANENITKVKSADVIKQWKDDLIFEGAQGLLLDQNNELFFPHVTHSNTGIKNACQLLKEWKIKSADVYYITRSYLTRHGAGPLPFEDASMHFLDKTNEPNEYQGTLRFAPLNIDLLTYSISNDLKNANDIDLTTHIVMTCTNQIENALKYVHNDVVKETKDFADVCKLLNTHNIHISNGPTAESISFNNLKADKFI